MNLLKRYLKQKDRIEKECIKVDIKKVKESIKEGKNKIRRLKCKNLEAIEEFLNNKGFQIKEVYEIYIESRLGTTKLDKINIVIEPKSKKVMN